MLAPRRSTRRAGTSLPPLPLSQDASAHARHARAKASGMRPPGFHPVFRAVHTRPRGDWPSTQHVSIAHVTRPPCRPVTPGPRPHLPGAARRAVVPTRHLSRFSAAPGARAAPCSGHHSRIGTRRAAGGHAPAPAPDPCSSTPATLLPSAWKALCPDTARAATSRAGTAGALARRSRPSRRAGAPCPRAQTQDVARDHRHAREALTQAARDTPPPAQQEVVLFCPSQRRPRHRRCPLAADGGTTRSRPPPGHHACAGVPARHGATGTWKTE